MPRGQVNDFSEITADCADYTDYNDCTRRREDTEFLSLRENCNEMTTNHLCDQWDLCEINLDSLRILGF